MTPQRVGVIPAPLLARLRETQATYHREHEAYRQAVAEALKAGGSVREVARVTGLSTSTVQAWGRARGWPTPQQQEAWGENRGVRDEWDAKMAAAQAMSQEMSDEQDAQGPADPR